MVPAPAWSRDRLLLDDTCLNQKEIKNQQKKVDLSLSESRFSLPGAPDGLYELFFDSSV